MSSATLHKAVYDGDIERVRELVDGGADVNARAQPGENWITAMGDRPRPLNCCAIAWTLTEAHLEIARLLIERGAVVDDSVLKDYLVEATEAEIWRRLYRLLGSVATPRWPGVEDDV